MLLLNRIIAAVSLTLIIVVPLSLFKIDNTCIDSDFHNSPTALRLEWHKGRMTFPEAKDYCKNCERFEGCPTGASGRLLNWLNNQDQAAAMELLNPTPNKGIEKAHDEDSYTIWFATSNGASLQDKKYIEFNHEGFPTPWGRVYSNSKVHLPIKNFYSSGTHGPHDVVSTTTHTENNSDGKHEVICVYEGITCRAG